MMSSAKDNGTDSGHAEDNQATRAYTNAVSLHVGDQAIWIDLAKQVEPERSLERGADTARFLATTSSITTGILASFGGPVIMQGNALLPATSLATAFLASLLPLVYLAPRLTRVNPEDLAAVERWYRGQADRRWLLVLAGALLPISLILAGGAVVSTGLRDSLPYISASIQSTAKGELTATTSVVCTRCVPASSINVGLVARSAAGARFLASAVLTPDEQGAGAIEVAELALQDNEELVIQIDGRDSSVVKAP